LQDDFLQETLTRLQEDDDAWLETRVGDLARMVSGSWRNAGRWHLAVEAPDPEMAVQAVDVWADVIDERVNAAIQHARQVVALDTRMVPLAETLSDMALRVEELRAFQAEMSDALDAWREAPPGGYDRWRLLGLAARAADWGPGWAALLDGFPPPDADASEYLDWTRRAQGLVAAELAALPAEIDALEVEYAALAAQYADEAEKSLALSATLSVEKPTQVQPRVEDVRPAATLMLVGGVLAVLTWLLAQLAWASRNGK
jgi:hypothetical protein